MDFRYFRDPHHFAQFVQKPQTCALCGQQRPGYAGPFYGRGPHVEFVCEPCLQEGRLAEHGLTTNDPRTNLRRALAAHHPDWAPAEVERVAQERLRELTERTPRPQTWQDLLWPAHCDDFCCYVKEAGKADLNALAPDGDGLAFLAAHLAEPHKDVAGLWEAMRPDSPADLKVAYNAGFYLFQCRRCGEYVILWDCN